MADADYDAGSGFSSAGLSDRLRGKAFPHNYLAEQSVLGGAMLRIESRAMMLASLHSDDFYDPKHQLIFDAISTLNIEQKPCDILTVTNQLVLNGNIGRAGGREYVSSLPGMLPFASNYQHYIDLVRDYAVKRRLILALDEVIGQCFSSDLESEKLIELAARRVMDIRGSDERTALTPVGEVLSEYVNKLYHIASGERPSLLRTGYPGLDRVLTGLRKGSLYVLASRPGVGKSAFSLNIAYNIAQYYRAVVAVFSLEMGKEEVAKRFLSARTSLTFQDLELLGPADKTKWDLISEGIGAFYDMPIYIDDHSAINVVEIHARCRQLQLQKRQLDLVIVDYLQLMGSASRHSRAENRQQQIAEISRLLKVMARDLDVPVLALSQLSRDVEKGFRRPRLADLRESGAIEQDADVVMFLHDPKANDPDDSGTGSAGIIELIVEKNRQGEKTTVELEWNPSSMTFSEPGYRGMPDPPSSL